MKGVMTILLCICFCVGGVSGQRSEGGKPKVDKGVVKKPADKKLKNVAKAGKPAPPPVPQMPADTGLIKADTQRSTVDTAKSTTTPDKIAIWKEPEDTFGWLPWLSLAVAVGAGISVIWTNSNFRHRLKKVEKNLSRQEPVAISSITKPGISSIEVESLITSSPVFKKMQDECTSLRGMVEKLQPAAKVIPMHGTPPPPAEDPSAGTFYMTAPTSNYFPANARSAHKESTAYKFVLQPGGHEAKFELHTMGASVSEIIKVIESYIKPACDEENLPTAGTRNIVTKEPGMAILENDKWVIKHKAIIRYE